jgi:hypothetical protein
MAKTLYMVIEHFRTVERCFQLMEADDRQLLDAWMARWSDLVDFEVHVVITSAEASAAIGSRL